MQASSFYLSPADEDDQTGAMGSLRFPFSLLSPQVPPPHHSSISFCKALAVAATSGAALAAGVAVSQKPINPFLKNALDFFNDPRSSSPFWASISIVDSCSSVSQPNTGFLFPSWLNDSRQLLGIGLWKKKCVTKDIVVYAFGVYGDDGDLKRILSGKYRWYSFSNGKDFRKHLLEDDICMTVRLRIVHTGTTIKLVREAFEESVGGKLQKLGGSHNEKLLHSFTSQFKDEYKIRKGSVIDLSREQGYVLRTTIDGKEVGTIQSQLLCWWIFDLYIGEDPLDTKAKKDVELVLASLYRK